MKVFGGWYLLKLVSINQNSEHHMLKHRVSKQKIDSLEKGLRLGHFVASRHMLQKTRLICKGWCGWNVKTRICPIQCLETIWITLVVTVGIIWDPIECFEQMICSCVRFSVRCCLKRFAVECMKKTHQHVEDIKVPFRPFRHYYIHKHIHRHHLQEGWIGGAWWPGGYRLPPQQWWRRVEVPERMFLMILFSLFAKQRGKESHDEHIYLNIAERNRLKCWFLFLWVFSFLIVRTSFLKHLVISWHVVFSPFWTKRYVHRLGASCFGFGGWWNRIVLPIAR